MDIPPTIAVVPWHQYIDMLGWRAVPGWSLHCPDGGRGYIHCLSCTLPYGGRHVHHLPVGAGNTVVHQYEVQEAGG